MVAFLYFIFNNNSLSFQQDDRMILLIILVILEIELVRRNGAVVCRDPDRVKSSRCSRLTNVIVFIFFAACSIQGLYLKNLAI